MSAHACLECEGFGRVVLSHANVSATCGECNGTGQTECVNAYCQSCLQQFGLEGVRVNAASEDTETPCEGNSEKCPAWCGECGTCCESRPNEWDGTAEYCPECSRYYKRPAEREPVWAPEEEEVQFTPARRASC